MHKRSVYNRKKYQRDMNKIVRKMNKSIQDDWLWNGRFYIRQTGAWFHPYSDHSGALFEAILECVDRKTGKKTEKVFDNYSMSFNFYLWVNECITEIFKVWDEVPNPNEQARAAGRVPDEI